MPSQTDSEQGFSLVEVLVAFTVLSLAMIVSLQAASQAIRFLGQAERTAAMLRGAQSLLDRARGASRIATGRSSGATPDGYHWSLDIAALPDSPAPEWTRHRAYAVEVRIAEIETLQAPLRLSTVVVAMPER